MSVDYSSPLFFGILVPVFYLSTPYPVIEDSRPFRRFDEVDITADKTALLTRIMVDLKNLGKHGFCLSVRLPSNDDFVLRLDFVDIV